MEQKSYAKGEYMGLIANQMMVEMLCHMTEKIKRACIKSKNITEKTKNKENGKEQDYESSKRERI
ncbi:MAG: hypothetical protein K2M22_12880 [Lachnospiraceae bacterium]|nr:hypothetical protein [Lachnospiraceae bacterium]MDE7177194.1 hypothetical protein [Lachnospiraceae bacterium]